MFEWLRRKKKLKTALQGTAAGYDPTDASNPSLLDADSGLSNNHDSAPCDTTHSDDGGNCDSGGFDAGGGDSGGGGGDGDF